MEPLSAPFIVIKLKPGWALDHDGGSIRRRGLGVVTSLPAGSSLVAALPLKRPVRGSRTLAELELARYVHLLLPAGLAADAVLKQARAWAFVERAELSVNPP
jgi:hypothetical protein